MDLPRLFDSTRTHISKTGLKKRDKNPQPGCSLLTHDVSEQEAASAKAMSRGTQDLWNTCPMTRGHRFIPDQTKGALDLRQAGFEGRTSLSLPGRMCTAWAQVWETVHVGGEWHWRNGALWVIKQAHFWSAEHLITTLFRLCSHSDSVTAINA